MRSDYTSQKILDNSKHCDASKPSLLQRVKSLWKSFLVQVLGLTPIPKKKEHEGNSDGEVEGAFELLRVCVYRPIMLPLSSNRRQVRNRFASSISVGGYRDMNFKIRVGFMCDSQKGRPRFCSVSVALRWNSFVMTSSYCRVQKALGPGRREDDGATMCFVVQLSRMRCD